MHLASAVAQTPTTLRYQFKAGDDVYYTSIVKTTVKGTGKGQSTSFEIVATLDWRLKVLEAGKNGDATIVYTVDRFQMMGIEGMRKKQIMDTNNLHANGNSESELTMWKAVKKSGLARVIKDPLGRTTAVKILVDVKGKEKEALEDVVRGQCDPILLVFSEQGLSKGQNWKGPPVGFDRDGIKTTLEQTFVYQGSVTLDGKNLEKVEIWPTLTSSDMKGIAKFKSDGKGIAFFDKGAGRLVEANQTINLTVEVDLGDGQTRTTTVRHETTLKLRTPPNSGVAAKRDMEKLQGIWIVTAITENGKKMEGEIRMEFKGDKVTMSEKGEPRGRKGTYTIDPEKSPATIDIPFEDGEDTLSAIYQLKGDELKICGGEIRPNSFEATANNTVLITLKRQKP